MTNGSSSFGRSGANPADENWIQRGCMSKATTNERGFGVVELIVVVGLVGLLTTLAVPNMLTYWRQSSLSAGASELAGVLNRARQLAISQNTVVCVQVTGSSVQFRTAGCAATNPVWAGPGTSRHGAITLSNGLQVAGATSAVFTNLGAASPGATYTVTDPRTSQARDVVVASTGRVRVQ